jgi:hypothetical protein
MLPTSGCMNKYLDNKEETTYRKVKEKKTRKKYKRVNGYLKNMPNQNNNIKSLKFLLPCREGKTT